MPPVRTGASSAPEPAAAVRGTRARVLGGKRSIQGRLTQSTAGIWSSRLRRQAGFSFGCETRSEV